MYGNVHQLREKGTAICAGFPDCQPKLCRHVRRHGKNNRVPFRRRALLNECVQELLRLYRKTPGSFLTSSAAALPLRSVGKKLGEAGGFELMRQAHELFSANSPGMGLARNLEMAWKGIGGSRG